jgi:uncharacterized protein
MPDNETDCLQLLTRGMVEFNRGCSFEAHELWEEAWNEVVGEEKRFYQGLVQIAAGYHKLSLSQVNGARKLLQRGRETLSTLPPNYAGVNLAPLLAAAATLVRDLAAGRVPIDPDAPILRFLPSFRQ